MNLFENVYKLLNEEVFGNMATVYHRTPYESLVSAVYTEGFKPGDGDFYGKAFYGTYKLESQEEKKMKRYGNTVVKFAVPTHNFFFFDWSEYAKSPLSKELESSPSSFIKDQVKHYKLSYPADRDEWAEFNATRFNTSSKMAIRLYNNSNIANKVNGLVFTGENDGMVLVCYKTSTLIPLAQKKDGEEVFTKVEKNKEYLKKATVAKYTDVKKKDYKYNEFEWVKNATTEGAVYKIGKTKEFRDPVVIWKRGTWKMGNWQTGIFENGTFENGTWLFGIFKGGHWKFGRWEGGTWEGGTWERGLILDPQRLGNYKDDWEWTVDEFVMSPINPAEYWKGKN